MNLKGVLDFSLGNFLCLRGFARMGVLYDVSEPDPSIQRDLLRDHREEMIAFLNQGEFLFFPEVILCTSLSHNGERNDSVEQLLAKVKRGESFRSLRFDDYRISSSARRTRNPEDTRAFDIFQIATIDLNKKSQYKFSRIDGNHRLSATSEDQKFRAHNTPFCLIFFQDKTEAARLSRALFHNINYKQVPLTMEQNLHLILDDADLFPDDKLRNSPSFGWAYYLARQLNNRLDLDLLANLRPFIEKEQRTFFVQQFIFLLQKKVLAENENAIRRYKEALGRVNATLDQFAALKDSENPGLLAALVYYELQPSVPTTSFVRWVLENHLHLIERSSGASLIQIFDKVLESRKRTIFVSMPFGKNYTENHFKIIERICYQVSETHNLKPPLKVERVDWFHDGTSYVITDKIIQMMSDCGLLIGDLTYGNANVYHEIGFVMGQSKAEGKDSANILLFLDEGATARKDSDRAVAFNLRGVKQLRFTETEEFAKDLRKNIELFFKL